MDCEIAQVSRTQNVDAFYEDIKISLSNSLLVRYPFFLLIKQTGVAGSSLYIYVVEGSAILIRIS